MSLPRSCPLCGFKGHYRRASCRGEGDKFAGLYGVYPHAFWRTDSPTSGHVEINLDGGHVVREVGAGVPYSRMTPVKTFKREADAEKFAHATTFGSSRSRSRRRRSR